MSGKLKLAHGDIIYMSVAEGSSGYQSMIGGYTCTYEYFLMVYVRCRCCLRIVLYSANAFLFFMEFQFVVVVCVLDVHRFLHGDVSH